MIPYNITLLHKITPLPVYVCRYMHSFCSVACQSTYIMDMNYSTKPALLVLAILLLIISPAATTILAVEASSVSTSLSTAAGGFRPMEATAIGRKGDVDLWRRRLAPFQLCLRASAAPGQQPPTVLLSCCGIDCQLPNKPYGVWGFVPKSCNCTSCATV